MSIGASCSSITVTTPPPDPSIMRKFEQRRFKAKIKARLATITVSKPSGFRAKFYGYPNGYRLLLARCEYMQRLLLTVLAPNPKIIASRTDPDGVLSSLAAMRFMYQAMRGFMLSSTFTVWLSCIHILPKIHGLSGLIAIPVAYGFLTYIVYHALRRNPKRLLEGTGKMLSNMIDDCASFPPVLWPLVDEYIHKSNTPLTAVAEPPEAMTTQGLDLV